MKLVCKVSLAIIITTKIKVQKGRNFVFWFSAVDVEERFNLLRIGSKTLRYIFAGSVNGTTINSKIFARKMFTVVYGCTGEAR